MTDKDLERIAKMFALTLDARVERIAGKLDQIQALLEQVKSEIISEFNQSLDNRDGVGDVDPYPQIDQEYLNGMVEARKSLDAWVDKIIAYCAEKGIDLPTGGGEEMIRLIQESRKHRPEQELENRRKKELDAKGAELKRRFQEMRDREARVTAEVNAYYTEIGVVPPEIDYDEEYRKTALSAARYRVEQELKRRREEEKKQE